MSPPDCSDSSRRNREVPLFFVACGTPPWARDSLMIERLIHYEIARGQQRIRGYSEAGFVVLNAELPAGQEMRTIDTGEETVIVDGENDDAWLSSDLSAQLACCR